MPDMRINPAGEWVPMGGLVADSRPKYARYRRGKLCATCGGPRNKPGQRNCRRCHAEYMRAYRARRAVADAEARDELARLRALVGSGVGS